MKKNRIFILAITVLLVLSVCLLLSGCTKEAAASMDYLTTVDGQDIIITFPAGTKSEGSISSDNGKYTFSYFSDGTLNIIYPNGYEYSQMSVNGATATSWDYEKTPEDLGFISGFSLAWSIDSASRTESSNTQTISPLLSVLIVCVGVWFTWKPKSIWWLARGWMFKNVEPSDLALGIYRVLGVIIAIIGIISFFT